MCHISVVATMTQRTGFLITKYLVLMTSLFGVLTKTLIWSYWSNSAISCYDMIIWFVI